MFVRGAVNGALCGKLQGVEEGLTLDAEGAVQLEPGVADPTGPVVHQLETKKETLVSEASGKLQKQLDHGLEVETDCRSRCCNFHI